MSLPVVAAPRTTERGMVVLALLMRLVLFAGFQGVIALILAIGGTADAWSASAAWWPIAAAATSAVTFAFLRWRARREGFSLAALYRPQRQGRGRDILWAVLVALVGGGLAVAGSILLAPVFFSNPQVASGLLAQPLPLWAAILAVIVFPAGVALTELPLYFGYVQPRVRTLTGSAVAAVLIPSIMLSLQHATLPLLFDPSFIAWRALMFIGFALVLGWVLWKRPRLLPYLIVLHFLLDLQAAVTILIASM